jgi:hypothetical protein
MSTTAIIVGIAIAVVVLIVIGVILYFVLRPKPKPGNTSPPPSNVTSNTGTTSTGGNPSTGTTTSTPAMQTTSEAPPPVVMKPVEGQTQPPPPQMAPGPIRRAQVLPLQFPPDLSKQEQPGYLMSIVISNTLFTTLSSCNQEGTLSIPCAQGLAITPALDRELQKIIPQIQQLIPNINTQQLSTLLTQLATAIGNYIQQTCLQTLDQSPPPIDQIRQGITQFDKAFANILVCAFLNESVLGILQQFDPLFLTT